MLHPCVEHRPLTWQQKLQWSARRTLGWAWTSSGWSIKWARSYKRRRMRRTPASRLPVSTCLARPLRRTGRGCLWIHTISLSRLVAHSLSNRLWWRVMITHVCAAHDARLAAWSVCVPPRACCLSLGLSHTHAWTLGSSVSDLPLQWEDSKERSHRPCRPFQPPPPGADQPYRHGICQVSAYMASCIRKLFHVDKLRCWCCSAHLRGAPGISRACAPAAPAQQLMQSAAEKNSVQWCFMDQVYDESFCTWTGCELNLFTCNDCEVEQGESIKAKAWLCAPAPAHVCACVRMCV